MFIRSIHDVNVYAEKIYSWIVSKKGKGYVEFVQELFIKNKIEKALNIVIADIYDYFDDLNIDKQNEYNEYDEYKTEKIRIREEIDEKIYILDEAFSRYVYSKFIKRHKSEKHNLMYLIKSILLSVKDINSNILYAIKYNKNKDANIHIKYIIAKYTDAKIKITPCVLREIGVKSDKSISIYEFYPLYEKYVENQIKKFETEEYVRKEIELKEKDLLVFDYLLSRNDKFVNETVEEIAKDCGISIATVSRAIKKLAKARKIIVHKKNNRNIYEIVNYKEETEKQKEYSKTKSISIKRSVKDIEVQISESDYRKYKRNEKLDSKTKYKLYLYRIKYQKELERLYLRHLSRDDALFFLINTEKLVENESLTLQQVLKIIKYADSNPKIENPIGWLIERFSIGRRRFYFLLQKSKQNEKQEVTISKKYEHQEQENAKPNKNKYVYINEDLLYFAKKYNIPESDILFYLRKLKNLDGDVSYIVEMYLANRLWKDYLSQEQKQELIEHAKHQIKKFVVSLKPEEIESYMKSIIRNEIKSRYLTLSIEDKIRLSTNQYYDTSY